MIELTDSLGSGYWLDVHFIRGKTRRLFYPTYVFDDDGGGILDIVNWVSGWGVILYTDDERPVRVYKKGLAAIEIVEAVASEASCDDTTETAN